MSTVSVVIPTYNSDTYLKEVIDSIIENTYILSGHGVYSHQRLLKRRFSNKFYKKWENFYV